MSLSPPFSDNYNHPENNCDYHELGAYEDCNRSKH